MEGFPIAAMAFVTLAALVPITNPPGNAPIFLALTAGMSDEERTAMARRVATNCFGLLVGAAFVGTYVLEFFGVSLPVVRVAGGLVVAATGWNMLTAEAGDPGDAPKAARPLNVAEVEGRAFYPMSFPLTVGPGSISTAITLGASIHSRETALLWNAVGMTLGIAASAFLIYLAFRFASRLIRLLGETGTAVFLRLSAFILMCIGVQITWDGASELLRSLK